MRRFGSYLPFIVLGGIAFIAYQIGNTFDTFLTIFVVLVWALAGLLIVYMVLFRNVKLTLFSSAALQPPSVFVDEGGVYHAGKATAATDVQVEDGMPLFDDAPDREYDVAGDDIETDLDETGGARRDGRGRKGDVAAR